MADTDDSENQKIATDQSINTSDSANFDATKPNTLKSLSLPRFGKARLNLPKFGLPRFKLSRPKVSFKKVNFLGLWLVIILISYICMGYFLSVLLTIPNRQTLAIAGFVIFGLLPTVTAFADYALMKWSYLLSGFLVVGGLIFLVKLKFYLMVLAILTWVGVTAIAFVGDVLIKKRKRWIAIGILTATCFIGLGIGYQMWRLAASWS